MSIIEIKNLTKKYSETSGCFGVNLAINHGEVFGFIGANGAGKTTLIKQMVGFIKPQQGSCRILERDTWKEASLIMNDLGYVGGEITLPSYLTGKQYLKMIASIRKDISWDYVEKLITYFEFNSKTKIKKMSKGMKQKVALIAAFMHKPKVLILDEPTSGLDPLMQEKFNKIISNFKKDGAIIFMSSHIFGEIESNCDRIAIIKKGKIITELVVGDLLNKDNKVYALAFDNNDNYQNILNAKFNVINSDHHKKLLKIMTTKENHDELLKEINTYQPQKVEEIPFNLEEYFLQFYQEEVKFDD